MSKLVAKCALTIAVAAAASACAAPADKTLADVPEGRIEADGTVVVPSFRLPPSLYLSDQAKALMPRTPTDILDLLNRPGPELVAFRNQVSELLAPRITELKRLYGVTTQDGQIAGVPAAWARPAAGVVPARSRKILLNLPGGGFVIANAKGMGMVESIPLAGILGVEVVSITYRQAPEARYPAATEDAVKVYREILKTHKPQDVVIFGCSAGGFLTAQTTAALIRQKLPLPAAIGIFCASADMRLPGDSSAFNRPFDGLAPREGNAQYFAGVDVSAPAVSPILAPEVLKQFPPTLLIEGLRTLELSGALATNNALEKAGVVSQLNVWDGMGHAFHYEPSTPESREAFGVMARFFGRYLRLSP